MVTQRTKKRVLPPGRGKPPKAGELSGRRPFYLREWRKFMGTKPMELAIALGIERQSYHRLEKNWWTINLGEMDIICRIIGVKQSQLWFPPPTTGQQERISLDELLEDIPENMHQAAFMALRGMAGK
jgi:DNA-binding XRE family transcriptional regulator